MKKNAIKELQTKTEAELAKLLQETEKALQFLKLDKEQNKLKNTREIFHKRKEMAVLKTILRVKEGEVKNG